MPHSPAAAMVLSCRRVVPRRGRGYTSHSAGRAMMKRVKSISTGVKAASNTLVEMKVLPQIRTVNTNRRCPVTSLCCMPGGCGGMRGGRCCARAVGNVEPAEGESFFPPSAGYHGGVCAGALISKRRRRL